MNIYLVTRHDRHYNEGSDYESFVCVAESEEDAKMLHPDDFRMEINDRGLFTINGQTKRSLAMDKWARKPENVSVEMIGTVSNSNYEGEGVICASKED